MNSVARPIRCVIFDIDGTLTRTNELIFESFNHVAEQYTGKRLTDREIIALFGPPEEGGLARIVGERVVQEAMESLCEYYRSHHHRLAALHEGIEEVLQFLRRHAVHLAVFTGKGRKTTEITLSELGIGRFFDLVVSGSDVVNHKPHHEGIIKVMEFFGLAPEGVLMAGDTLADVRASRGAGVRMAACLWDSYDRERVLEAGIENVFESVKDFHEWLKGQVLPWTT